MQSFAAFGNVDVQPSERIADKLFLAWIAVEQNTSLKFYDVIAVDEFEKSFAPVGTCVRTLPNKSSCNLSQSDNFQA